MKQQRPAADATGRRRGRIITLHVIDQDLRAVESRAERCEDAFMRKAFSLRLYSWPPLARLAAIGVSACVICTSATTAATAPGQNPTTSPAAKVAASPAASPAVPPPAALPAITAAAAPGAGAEAEADGKKGLVTYTNSVKAALSSVRDVSPSAKVLVGLSKPRVVTVELEISEKGTVGVQRLAVSSGDNEIDDFARQWANSAEPFAAPDPALLDRTKRMTCVVRIGLTSGNKKVKTDIIVGCFAPNAPVPTVVGFEALNDAAQDAGAAMFRGWANETQVGAEAASTAQYHQAATTSQDWDLAARAFGLALVKKQRINAAIPFLRIYANSRGGAADALSYAREIERFEREQLQRQAEFTRLRPRLGDKDFFLGIKKGYPLLAPCLNQARSQRLLAVGRDTLVVTFKINKDGSVGRAQLDGPQALKMTEPADCIERKMLTWRFPPYSEGSEVTAKGVPLKVRGSPTETDGTPNAPAVVGGATASADASGAGDGGSDDLEVSSCERPADEVSGFIAARTGKLLDCLDAERTRARGAEFPDVIPVSFVIDSDGPVRGVAIGHRFFREGPLVACFAATLAGNLGPSGGADCPAEFNIDGTKLNRSGR